MSYRSRRSCAAKQAKSGRSNPEEPAPLETLFDSLPFLAGREPSVSDGSELRSLI